MERAIPILPVDDLRVARAFYVDKLGFTPTFENSDDGHTGLLGIARGTIAITWMGTGATRAFLWKSQTPTGTTTSGTGRSRLAVRPTMSRGGRGHSTCKTPSATRSSSWGQPRPRSSPPA